MDIKHILSVVAGLLFLAGYAPYIRAILRGETRPSKASWMIWATLDLITIAGMFAKHAINGQIIGATVGAWVVFTLSLKHGVPGWTKLDKLCLAGGALGILLWQAFSSPVMGIVTSSAAIFMGAIPTFKSAWHKPENEDRVAWTIYWLSCVVALAAIPHWTLADAAQPVVFSINETVVMYLLWLRPWLVHHE